MAESQLSAYPREHVRGPASYRSDPVDPVRGMRVRAVSKLEAFLVEAEMSILRRPKESHDCVMPCHQGHTGKLVRSRACWCRSSTAKRVGCRSGEVILGWCIVLGKRSQA